MSENDIEYQVAVAIEDAKCYLTFAYAADDPELREVVQTVIAAVLEEINAELERRISSAELAADEEDRSGFWRLQHMSERNALKEFQSYIRTLGNGGDDAR